MLPEHALSLSSAGCDDDGDGQIAVDTWVACQEGRNHGAARAEWVHHDDEAAVRIGQGDGSVTFFWACACGVRMPSRVWMVWMGEDRMGAGW
jgi:hypothetical protein